MGVAAYNRGSRRVSMEMEERTQLAKIRTDRQVLKDEIARMREQISKLERELNRARRCISSERAGREALRVRLSDVERANAFGVGVLCKLAFPNDNTGDSVVDVPDGT